MISEKRHPSMAGWGRIAWLDHAKGFCIILVVMLYATESVGNAAGQEGWVHAIASFAQPFRMPDFFLLSGLLLTRVIQRDLSFPIRRGDVFVIMGGSGCGKSTLLKHIIGLQEPAAGEILINGENFFAATPERQLAMRRGWGITYQRGGTSRACRAISAAKRPGSR